MHRPGLVAALLVVGIALMVNPLYLPVAVGEPTPAYTHVVQPVGPDTPEHADGDVIDSADLDDDARESFERALESADGGFVVEDPSDRVVSLSYPTDPTIGDGLVVVAHDGDRYEFWTRTVEREPGVVVAQRAVLQPVAFLVGFFSVLGAVVLALRERLS
ncbi:hypothetical protein [Halorubrum sp. DTA98]|uniref:hypothetical protein n=1 Tax=Halorubrum sp. DTA98 TaxID=3402163 RepID=UPI003AAD71A3